MCTEFVQLHGHAQPLDVEEVGFLVHSYMHAYDVCIQGPCTGVETGGHKVFAALAILLLIVLVGDSGTLHLPMAM